MLDARGWDWPLSLTEFQVEQLTDFQALLVEWNQKMNLTGITDDAGVTIKHFYDSLSVAHMSTWANRMKRDTRVIDVGTGAGFPGIPLAIAYPDVSFTLCDSLQKRVQFLSTVCDELQLTNVTCVHARSEDLGRDVTARGSFDFAVSRAVARLNILMELMVPFLKRGGYGVCYKGPSLDEEYEDGLRAAKKLQCHIESVASYELPLDMGARTLVLFEQTGMLSKEYPRKAGIPQKQPL